ncbi:protocadherin gamma-A11-like, partial [Nematolebias whitei]|uniref:protocadherin gamma-A11-like n=1 Tax=Nematolebias whitei TaxID=451745 RepID=UPI0018982875
MEQREHSRTKWIVCVIALISFWSPANGQFRYSVNEEVQEGTVVGNIAKDLGLDKTTLKERGVRIVYGSTEPPFTVNQDDGVLFVNRNIDREQICDRSKVCVVDLKTVLQNPLEIHHVSVEILDVNDHAPSFPENKIMLEISESALQGAKFQLKAARDADSGLLSVQQYKLSNNDHFRLEVKDRGEDRKTPSLVLEKPLDRESVKSHVLLLTALDGGRPPKSGNMTIIVNVSDVNDNPPVFSQESYSVSLKENSPVGTTVIQINATDPDEGSNGDVFYSFGKDVEPRARALFSLNPETGVIVVAGNIDFEETTKLEIDVQASDKGAATMTTDKTIFITIIDLNDNAPEIEVTSFSHALPEDSKPGTTVALISVKDSDSGLMGKVMCFINQEIPFLLTPSLQNNMYSLVTKHLLDREHQSHYSVIIVAKDAGDPALSSEKNIDIIVSDVNDNRPVFSQSPYTFYITENNQPGERIFSVTGQDQDDGSNAHISYLIMRDKNVENKLSSFLNIHSETGAIISLKSFDFESLKTFQFQVVATDSGAPSLSSNVTVNVFILDQNDNAPVILYPVSSNGSAEGVEEIPRNVHTGHLVTKVRAYDADIGYNGWLLFSMQEVSDHSLFGLDRYTGQIRTLRSFTETDESIYDVIIVAKDGGEPSLTSEKNIKVIISDVNDNSPVFSHSPYTFYISENNTPAEKIFSVTAQDQDEGSNAQISYFISRDREGANMLTSFLNINSETGDIVAMKSFDFESLKTFQFQVVATDSGAQSLSSNVTVNVFILDQ